MEAPLHVDPPPLRISGLAGELTLTGPPKLNGKWQREKCFFLVEKCSVGQKGQAWVVRIERQSSVPSPVADFLVVSVLKNPIPKIVVFNDHRHPKNAKLTTSGEFLVVSVSKNQKMLISHDHRHP